MTTTPLRRLAERMLNFRLKELDMPGLVLDHGSYSQWIYHWHDARGNLCSVAIGNTVADALGTLPALADEWHAGRMSP